MSKMSRETKQVKLKKKTKKNEPSKLHAFIPSVFDLNQENRLAYPQRENQQLRNWRLMIMANQKQIK